VQADATGSSATLSRASSTSSHGRGSTECHLHRETKLASQACRRRPPCRLFPLQGGHALESPSVSSIPCTARLNPSPPRVLATWPDQPSPPPPSYLLLAKGRRRP
jgi:hypothetical protein